MTTPASSKFSRIVIGCLMALTASTYGHDVPAELLAPESIGEAWNVIEQSKANIDQLLHDNLMRDVGAQIANIAGALKYLDSKVGEQAQSAAVRSLVAKLQAGDVELLGASRAVDDPRGKAQPVWEQWCKTLKELEGQYPPELIRAEVFICPMHPADRHLKADDKCSVCGMPLVRRHLPASGVYQKSGEPTFKLTVTSPPLKAGQSAAVLLNIAKSDGSPVTPGDLLEMHTRKIHLLINDSGLSDYHHEHPEPTDVPGQYRFSFTPKNPGPYRLWADVVPAATGVQEYDMIDLPSQEKGRPITDRDTRLKTVVDGRTYELTFDTKAKPIRARQTVVGAISVVDSDGEGFTQLEPVMGAFAHIVGFSADGKTVLHIHPFSKTPTGTDDRAGPAFAFKFYAPAAGLWRMYCQVQIAGVQQFAPFNVNVEPAELLK